MSRVLSHNFDPFSYSHCFAMVNCDLENLLSKKPRENIGIRYFEAVEEYLGLAHSLLVFELGFPQIRGIIYSTDSVKIAGANIFVAENYSRAVEEIRGSYKKQDKVIKQLIERNRNLRTIEKISKGERGEYQKMNRFYTQIAVSSETERVRRMYEKTEF